MIKFPEKKIHILRVLFFMLSIGYCLLTGCAAVIAGDKAPHEVWEKLATGDKQDLIVVFDDSMIQAQAVQFNKAKGIMLDDADTIRFKAEKYAVIKEAAISKLPSGEIEILREYEALPIMFLRFCSVATLKTFLSNPSVVKVYKDRPENMMPLDSKP